MLVPSPVLCTLIHRGRILTLGRGRWLSLEPGGVFFCPLNVLPSSSSNTSGAYLGVPVVIGGTGWKLVHSIVI